MNIDVNRYRVEPESIVSLEDINLDEDAIMVGGKRYTEADAERDGVAIEREIRDSAA